MKLRLRGNSIRLRLSQTEVTALTEGIDLMDSTGLAPGKSLEFGICPRATDTVEISATTRGFFIVAPKDMLIRWAESNDEGFEAHVAISASETTHVLVQKDFACLKPRGEEDHDTFTHPDAGTLKC